MSKHKCALIFLTLINLMNIAAGVITQLKLVKGSDVTSVIPITINLTVDQILIVNFLAVCAVFTLITVVTTYLVTDTSYSITELISNCAGIFMIIPVLVLFVAVFNMINAPLISDKLAIIISAIIYLLMNVLNVGCLLTIREDE